MGWHSAGAGGYASQFQTRERLPADVLRNGYRPPSLVQDAFCEAFEAVWRQEMEG